jgi:hypothetical protein
MVVSPLLPLLARRTSLRFVWGAGEVVKGAVFVLAVLPMGKWSGLVLIAVLGIALSTTNVIPYALIGEMAPVDEMGIYMGVRNIWVS